jgi:hypothetical protein
LLVRDRQEEARVIPFTHWRSGIIWGFGTIQKRTGEVTATGPFSYIVAEVDEPVMRWTCHPQAHVYPRAEEYFGAAAWAVGRHQ